MFGKQKAGMLSHVRLVLFAIGCLVYLIVGLI